MDDLIAEQAIVDEEGYVITDVIKEIMDIETAIGIAARIWCDQDYEHITMNPDLAETIAVLLMNNANRVDENDQWGTE